MTVKRVLLLHIPQNPKSEASFIQVAPLGLVGMAHYIKDQLNIEVTVMNAGRLIARLPDIVISEYVLEKNFDLIILDLHWHQQLFDVLQTIDKLKTERNYIAVGGITASTFGGELLKKNPNIDFLIKGEGEIPTVELIKAINGKSNYYDVPNLIWKNYDNQIQENKILFQADSIFLNNLNDWDLTVYDNLASYCGKIKRNQKSPDFFYVPVGRGCMEECSYCAGSNSSFIKCFNRKYVTYRSPEAVARTIINVHYHHHFTNFYICYDIKEIPEEWWINAFEIISTAKIDIGLYFEAYRIPSQRFITAFKATFRYSKSQIILSPGCFSDIARFRYTNVRYTLGDLYDFLVFVNNEIPIYIYFSLIPNPEEVAVENIIFNTKWCQKILDCFWNVAIYVSPIVMEPNAPWENTPEKYGIEKEINDLDDFINNSNLYIKSNMALGYKFDCNKLIAAIYYGITSKISLMDFDIDEVIIVNSISEISCLNCDLSEKTLIINSDRYDDFINALFRYRPVFSAPDRLLFRKILSVKDILSNIGVNWLENTNFISMPLYYAIRLRDCVAYEKEIITINVCRHLLSYKIFFDNLKYHLRACGSYDNGNLFIINAVPQNIFPLIIQTEEHIKYYVASKNGNLFKEVSYIAFKSLCNQLNET